MTDEPRYTKAEWEAMHERQACQRDGHDYDVISMRTAGDAGRPISIRCTVCRKAWPVSEPCGQSNIFTLDGAVIRTPNPDLVECERPSGHPKDFHSGGGKRWSA